jgi:hypothetical protein
MSEQHPSPRSAPLFAVLAAGLYLAFVVAYWGVLGLVLDREVIDYSDAGPLLGPAMVIAGCIVVALSTHRARSWLSAFPALAVCFVVMVLVGAIGYFVTRGEASWLVTAAVHFAISPFVAGAAVLAALVVAGAAALRPASVR